MIVNILELGRESLSALLSQEILL